MFDSRWASTGVTAVKSSPIIRFFSPTAAKERMKIAQHPFIDRLADALAGARYARASAA